MKDEHFRSVFEVDRSSSGDRLSIALLQLMKQKKFCDISVTELCQVAGLSRKTFYKFFSKKEDLIPYLKENTLLGYHEYRDRLDISRFRGSMAGFYHYFSYWYLMRDWVDVLVENDMWEAFSAYNEQAISLIRPRNWNLDHDGQHKNLEMVYSFISSGLSKLVREWSEEGYIKTPEEMAELVVFILSGSIAE